jgi:hypothetical protein
MYHTTGFTEAEITELAQELRPASFRQGYADGRQYSDCAMRSP